jgi:dienelactone hydrolase
MQKWIIAGTAILLTITGARAQAPVLPPIVIADPLAGSVRVESGGVFGNYVPGAGAGPRPGILLLAGSEGGLPIEHIASALQAEGFGVLQLCYFGCPGLPEKLVNVPLETFANGLEWLRRQPDIDPARLAILGGSKGAEAALLAASRASGLKAVIATQHSSVAWPGIAYTPQMQPGWTEQGRPIAFLPYANVSIAEKGLFARYNEALPDLPAHPGAVIPVERLGAPVMLICGEADSLWPSCPMSDQIAARLRQSGKPAPLILRYPNAGHEVFGLPIAPSDPHYAHLGSLGGTPAGIAAAHADAWPRVVEFLRQNLK